MAGFPHFYQTDAQTCGPTCLRMIAAYYGKNYGLDEIVKLCQTTRVGSNLLGLSKAAEKMKLTPTAVKVSIKQLSEEISLPCIAHWKNSHFIVIKKVSKKFVYVSDPALGATKHLHQDFQKNWAGLGQPEGVLLLLKPTNEFDTGLNIRPDSTIISGFQFIFGYFKKYRKDLLRLIIGLIAGTLFQLLFPILTQCIVDVGIANKDFTFINLILAAQLMLFLSRITIDAIRSFILLHISSRINISLVSDFFFKLMSLPISYFDKKMTGDLMQRISDNKRIEGFLTGSSLSIVFSIFNLIIFSGLIILYSLDIFFVFLAGSVIHFTWIVLFSKKRARLDNMRFKQSSENQSKIIEIINGMQEIKLNNAERNKRWQLEDMQVKLFRINLKSLNLSTIQHSGAVLINEIKSIIVTFMSAKLVIDGQLSLGMMLSISYIIGQLTAPIMDMVRFIQSFQDARLSLERLGEIHNKPNEENSEVESICELDLNLQININNLSFHYEGAEGGNVIRDVSFQIPAKKITAIVGSSGSGKTTLIKLLLKFYSPTNGTIKIGDNSLNDIDIKLWRDKCGVVMQEGFIFNDTIANNIAVGGNEIDSDRLMEAIRIANIKEFIETLPLGLNTKIGLEGVGISMGQKQRILIARAIYKNPDYLFFDEATSALDSKNEKAIVENLNNFYKNKTVIIIAHRLSTVINADQILVLENGSIIEKGGHEELILNRGPYFELVKNQIEMNS